MIEKRNKAWIEVEWRRRVRNVIVREFCGFERAPANFKDFNHWYLNHMDSGDYSVEQTIHEIIVHWRPSGPPASP